MKIDKLDLNGKKNSIEVLDNIFSAKVNRKLVETVLYKTNANYKGRHAKTKQQNEVAGPTSKIYAQKGTGNARHASRKAPIFVGGGVAHGPGTRVYKDRTPKKMKSKALAMAISQRISEESVFVIDGNGIDSPSTKLAASAVKEFDIKRSFTLVYSDEDEVLFKSFRNLEESKLVSVSKVAAIDIISTDHTIFSTSAISKYLGDE